MKNIRKAVIRSKRQSEWFESQRIAILKKESKDEKLTSNR